MSDQPSAGAHIQIQLLKSNLPLPKWESGRNSGMTRVGGAWNEKWEQQEKQKVIQKIDEHKDYILKVFKDDFYLAKAQLEKRNRPFPEGFGVHMIAIGSLAVLGFEDLLRNEQIMDERFIQDILSLSEKGECREGAAYALLGLELAFKNGRFIPQILEVFDQTQSLRLARHLGKISWDSRVVDSLVKATAANFLTTEMDGLSLKSYDGVGLLSALSLLEINDQGGLEGMVASLLRLKESQLPDKLLVYAGDAALPGLIAGLKQEDINNSRARAAACLGEIGSGQAVQPLIDALQDQNDSCVIAAVRALAKLGDPTAIPGLLGILGHRSLLVRTAASAGLKKMKDIWQPEPFLSALAEKDQAVQLFAIEAVAGMKSKDAIEPLKRLVESESRKVKKAAEKALKKLN